MNSPITPTVGRIVLFRSQRHLDMGNGALEVPAIVTRVWGPNCVNLQVFRDAEPPAPVTSVMYDDGEQLSVHAGWRWMPYQKAVAAGEIEPTRHA